MTNHRLRVSAKDYYDALPPGQHSPGDVWTDVPTLGLLPSTHCSALIITPACDLANQKVETVTYLPVLPVCQYMSTPAFMPEIQRELQAVAAQLGIGGMLDRPSFAPPSAQDLDAFESLLRREDGKQRSPKEQTLVERATAGIAALRNGKSRVASNVDPTRILCGTKTFDSIVERIIRNSYRQDIHFLPMDEQPPDWSAVNSHSVALFRYVLSAPLEIFLAAQDTTIKDWAGFADSIAAQWPVASAFREMRPVKRLTVKPRFLSDLLTRYVGMFVRLGSPDFTSETVADYVREIGEK
jgi:hypothetical protein